MVVDIVVAVVNVVVVVLLVVTGHIKLWSIDFNLMLLKASVEFMWWGGWVVCTIIFMSKPIAVLMLCCVVVGVLAMNEYEVPDLMNEMFPKNNEHKDINAAARSKQRGCKKCSMNVCEKEGRKTSNRAKKQTAQLALMSDSRILKQKEIKKL